MKSLRHIAIAYVAGLLLIMVVLAVSFQMERESLLTSLESAEVACTK